MHGKQAWDDARLLTAAHHRVGVQHGTHQCGAAPRDAANEDERCVLVVLQRDLRAAHVLAQVQGGPGVAPAVAAVPVATTWAFHGAEAQVEYGQRADDHTGQQQNVLWFPHHELVMDREEDADVLWGSYTMDRDRD